MSIETYNGRCVYEPPTGWPQDGDRIAAECARQASRNDSILADLLGLISSEIQALDPTSDPRHVIYQIKAVRRGPRYWDVESTRAEVVVE